MRPPGRWGRAGQVPASIASAALGALLALTYGPSAWSAATILPLAVLFLHIQRAPSPRSAFTRGLWSGIGFFAVLLAWLPVSFSRLFGAVVVPPMLLLPALLGLFWGLTAGAARWAGRWTLATLPFAWVVTEYLRSLGPFGFTWGTMGYALLQTPLIQTAALGGVYLASLLVTLSAAALAALTLRVRWPTLLVLPLLLAAGLYGAGASVPAGPQGAALLVQGSLDPLSKAAGRSLGELTTYTRLTMQGLERAGSAVDLVVWPETASPLPLDDPRALTAVASFRTPAIIGAPSYRNGYQNSAYAVDDGAIVGRYSKVRLVPFGEYFPLRRTLAFTYDPLFAAIGLPGLTSATPGTAYQPLKLGAIVAGTYICYESTFPAAARTLVSRGANVLVNISNDAWFGRTRGAEQHFQMGRVRAIETRRYLLRAGNDGITAAIDPRGRVLARLPRGARTATVVPYRLESALTPYVRWGDRPVAAAAIATAALLTLGLATRAHDA